MTPQQVAHSQLNYLFLAFLSDLRGGLYEEIENNRFDTLVENEVTRPTLVAQIKKISAAIEEARASNAPQNVIDTLITQIQYVNRLRHHNRCSVKDLAFEQAVNKAMLAEVNREISHVEDLIAIDELDQEDDDY